MCIGSAQRRRSRDLLEWAERIDPVGHAFHVVAMLAWGFAQSISNAAEGVTWGMLLAVCVARIPKILRCWSLVVRDPLWLALMGWSGWMCLSNTWSPVPTSELKAWLPDRWLITPLLLWPVMLRPHLLLAAIGMGAFVQLAALLAMSWAASGWAVHLEIRSISGFGQLQWQLHCAAVTAAGAMRFIPGWPRAIASILFATSMFAVLESGRRLTFLTALAGTLVAWLRPRPRPSRAAAWAAIGAMLLAVAVAATLPLGSRLSRISSSTIRSLDRDEAYVALSTATGSRVPLAHAAWDLGAERMLAGHGRGSFRALLPVWAHRQLADHPERSKALKPLLDGTLNDAHNALLAAFCEGGLVASLFLGSALLGLSWRLWRQSGSSEVASVAAAIYVSVLLGMFCHPVTAKAPGAIIGVCIAVSWIGQAAAPPGRPSTPMPLRV